MAISCCIKIKIMRGARQKSRGSKTKEERSRNEEVNLDLLPILFYLINNKVTSSPTLHLPSLWLYNKFCFS